MISLRTRIVLLIAAAVLTYWNASSNPFLLDDHTSILTNASIESLTWPGPLATPSDTPVARRPLVNLSFAINYALDERDVTGYHVGNLLIHVLAALVLFGIVRRTLRLPPLHATFGAAADSLAWLCALVWVLHPLNSEVVDYVTQRTQAMLGLFYLLTMYCAIRAAGSRGPNPSTRSGSSRAESRDDKARATGVGERAANRWEVACVIGCAAGMLSKESMATAPLMVMLFDRAFLFESTRAQIARRGRLYAGLAATWVVLAIAIRSAARTSAGFGAGISPWDYLLTQARMIPHYLYLAAWPHALVADYGAVRPVALESVIVPGALLLLAALVTIVALFRWPRAAFPVAWFFVTLAPTSSVLPIATEVGAERRMYLALAGLVVLVVTSTYRFVGERRSAAVPLRVICAVVVAALAVGTVLRNREYADPVRLAESMVRRWPSGRAHVHLGTLYGERGDRDRELSEYQLGARLYPPGHYPLGVALVEHQQVDEGLAHLRRFIELRPRHAAVAGARDVIGRVLTDRGDLDGASRQFELLLAGNPADARSMVLLAEVRLRQKRTSEAIELYERAHRLDSGLGHNAVTMARYGSALASANRLEEAERIFAEGAGANPQNATLQKLWGRTLASSGRYVAAAERFRAARALAPDDPEARQLLAAIEHTLGVAWR